MGPSACPIAADHCRESRQAQAHTPENARNAPQHLMRHPPEADHQQTPPDTRDAWGGAISRRQTGLSLGDKKKGFVTRKTTNAHGDTLCLMIMGSSLLERLAVGRWLLAVGGGWRRLVVGGWWRLAVGGLCGLSLTKKNSGFLRTALPTNANRWPTTANNTGGYGSTAGDSASATGGLLLTPAIDCRAASDGPTGPPGPVHRASLYVA